MNRRSFVATCLGAAAGLAAKPLLECAAVRPTEPMWLVRKDVDPASWLETVRYSTRLISSSWKPPTLPPIKPGFHRKQIDFESIQLSDDESKIFHQVKIIDEREWIDAVVMAAEEARKNGFCEVPFPVEPNPFPVRS